MKGIPLAFSRPTVLPPPLSSSSIPHLPFFLIDRIGYAGGHRLLIGDEERRRRRQRTPTDRSHKWAKDEASRMRSHRQKKKICYAVGTDEEGGAGGRVSHFSCECFSVLCAF